MFLEPSDQLETTCHIPSLIHHHHIIHHSILHLIILLKVNNHSSHQEALEAAEEEEVVEADVEEAESGDNNSLKPVTWILKTSQT